jgi:hypothetical protein
VRRRLLISTLVVSVTAVVLLGVPLAFVIGRLQLSEAAAQVRRDAATLALSLQEQVKAKVPVTANEVGRSLPDRYVIIIHHGVGRITVGRRPPHGHTISAEALTKDFAVTVEADDSEVSGRVVSALFGVGALAGLAVAVAVGLAVWLARRLTRPMEELALAAERLGSGDARPLGRRYGIPELDQVAEGLDGSAQRITDLLSAGQDFAADASHQLRTPLTGLRITLEAADDPRTSRRWSGRKVRPRWPRPSGWPRWSASCWAGSPAGRWRERRRWPRSTTSWPSRSSSGTRRSGGSAASSR